VKPQIGEIFAERYLVIASLGSGGMGTVYHAKQIDADRDVALKLLHSEKLEEEDTVSRFVREFRVLSQLSHPHIMTFYGLALDDASVPFAICEFIDGVNLRTIIDRGPIGWQRVIRIAIQICNAMQYAHLQGIIHRDLKPDNVIVCDKPEADFVKLVDFGLSRALSTIRASDKLTSTGVIVGTPQYLSPEQICGQAEARSDIYALGCLLYEALAGESLFAGDTATAIIYSHINEDPSKRLRALGSDVPPSVKAVIEKTLQKKPEQRYESMSALSSDLEKIIENPETKALLANANVGKEGRPSLVIAASIAVVLLLLLGAAWLPGARHATLDGGKISNKSKAITHFAKVDESFDKLLEAQALSRKGQETQAIKLLKNYLQSSVPSRTPEGVYDLRCALAGHLLNQGSLQEAETEWQKAIDMFELPDSPRRLNAACGLARVYIAQNKFSKAEDTYAKYIGIPEQDGNCYSIGFIKAYDEYIHFLMRQGKFQKADRLAQQCIKYLDHLPHGSYPNTVQDRGTSEAVEATFVFYDLCQRENRNAAARHELDKTEAQLKSTSVRDEYTVRAVVNFARSAEKRKLYAEARAMYEVALRDTEHLSKNDATQIRAACIEGLKALDQH